MKLTYYHNKLKSKILRSVLRSLLRNSGGRESLYFVPRERDKTKGRRLNVKKQICHNYRSVGVTR